MKTCPIVEWYQFKCCDIRTCKNYTAETQHRCLEIDRKKPEGTKPFSDAELNLYKFKSRKISTRLVQIYRKEAIEKVKTIIILQKFIAWLEETYSERKPTKNIRCLQLEKEYPLKVARLGWRNWMWVYALDSEVFDKFKSKMATDQSDIQFYTLLSTTKEDFDEQANLKKENTHEDTDNCTVGKLHKFQRVGNEQHRRTEPAKRRDESGNRRRERPLQRSASSSNVYSS